MGLNEAPFNNLRPASCTIMYYSSEQIVRLAPSLDNDVLGQTSFRQHKILQHLTWVGASSRSHVGAIMNFWLVDQVKPFCQTIASWSGSAVYPLWQIAVHCICLKKLGRRALLAMFFADLTDDESGTVFGIWVRATFSISAEIRAG